MLLQLSHFFLPFIPSVIHPLPIGSPSLSSSPFPMLFLTSYLFRTYHLCFLFPVPFPPFSLLPLPADNPPCDLHFCESVPVLVVCLVCCLHHWLSWVSSPTVHTTDLDLPASPISWAYSLDTHTHAHHWLCFSGEPSLIQVPSQSPLLTQPLLPNS